MSIPQEWCPSWRSSRVVKWGRLEQKESRAGHVGLLLHLEGTALGLALHLLQQPENLL